MVSIDDYKELHAVIKKWIDEKRAAAQNREFPHSSEELKSLMATMAMVKSKEMPAKKREMKSLAQLSEQLQALKAKKPSTPAIPTEMEYSKLEQVCTYNVCMYSNVHSAYYGMVVLCVRTVYIL